MLGNSAEILQIAAAEGKYNFNVYVLPKRGVSAGASAVNKLVFKYGRLFLDGQPVDAVPLDQGLLSFLEWLRIRKSSMLCAHNAKAFDAKHLLKAISSCGYLEKFSEHVVGFCDTLAAFRELYPGRSCSQEKLASDLLHCSYSAHNAVDDVEILQKLSMQFIDETMLLKHSFTLAWFLEYSVLLCKKNKNLFSLRPLIISKVASKGMASKIAASGLTMAHLQLAFRRNGHNGIANLLLERFGGKPRVTNNKNVISKICSFFKTDCDHEQ